MYAAVSMRTVLSTCTGSMALNCYAQPRMTRDMDIVVALLVDDVKHFRRAESERCIQVCLQDFEF